MRLTASLETHGYFDYFHLMIYVLRICIYCGKHETKISKILISAHVWISQSHSRIKFARVLSSPIRTARCTIITHYQRLAALR